MIICRRLGFMPTRMHIASYVVDMKDEAWLYLEDGTSVKGSSFGSRTKRGGEIVFTTAMNGYPESLTDPSYKGQILVITHPLVGNYGIPKSIADKGILENFESEGIKAEGLVVSEVTVGSKWNSNTSLGRWMEDSDVPGISGIDTRALTKKIRERGVMNGIISPCEYNAAEDLKEDYGGINFVEKVSVKEPVVYEGGGRGRVVVVDLGIKHGILNEVRRRGYDIIRVPYDSNAEKIMSYEPSGILYSNGPGNPNLLSEQVVELKKLMEHNVPILGICLGQQLVTLALGGRVRKMAFGHRAVNKAVVNHIDGRAYITTHNHGYASYAEDLPDGVERWFSSPDDGVVEGVRCNNIITTQFHPESRPGANDTGFVFDAFARMIRNGKA